MITLKQIDKKLTTFTTSREKLKLLAHEIGMMVIRHAAPVDASYGALTCDGSGDCTRAIKLIREMPKSWAEQMRLWFNEFTPIRVVVKNDKCEFDPKYKKLSPTEKLDWWKVDAANTTPFFDLNEEPDVEKSYSFEELVALVGRLSKSIQSKMDRGEVKSEDEESAKGIVTILSGLRFNRVKVETPAADNSNADKSLDDTSKGENVTPLEQVA